MTPIRTVSATLLALALAACAAAPAPDDGEAPVAEATGELATPEDIEHACLHATFGPFRTVTASSSAATATVNINQEHTGYNVRLPLVSGRRQGVVVYRAVDSGEHAFFINPDVPLALRNASTNATVPVVSQQSVTPAECSTLTAVVTYNLTGGQSYKLTYGPTTASTVLTVVENLDGSLRGARPRRPGRLGAHRAGRAPRVAARGGAPPSRALT